MMPSVEKPGSLRDEGPDRRLENEGRRRNKGPEAGKSLWFKEQRVGAKPGKENGVGWREMVAIVFI